jgi:Predicted sugar kinase
MKKCEKFIIIPNVLKDEGLAKTEKLAEYIRKSGKEVSIHSISGYDNNIDIDDEAFKDVDMVIVMGGDGTMLRVSHLMENHDIPMIGVNLGTVGFLTEVNVADVESMVDRMIAGDYRIEDRMMLKGTVIRDGEIIADNLQALNDAILARESMLKLIAFKIYLNGEFFDECEADGVIISTPTGSTGYNLSAGGPIVNPGASLLVMTPISPYSLSMRSVIFGADDEISLELVDKRHNGQNKGLISFDGYMNVTMNIGDIAKVGVSDKCMKLARLDNSSVYTILRRKLGA